MSPDKTKTLQFDRVDIREYDTVLSNNPACRYGPSVELGWKYRQDELHHNLAVSQYEKERQGKRRSKASQYYLSEVQREATLQQSDFSKQDIKKATKEKNKARRQRDASNFVLNFNVPLMVREAKKNKKLARARRNLKKAKVSPVTANKQGEPVLLEHEILYKGWWLPFSGDIF